MRKAARELEFNKVLISCKRFAIKTIWIVIVAIITYVALHGQVNKNTFSSITAPAFVGWQAGKDFMDNVESEVALRDFKARIADARPKKDDEQ
jgi:hypothetical protein